MAGIPRLQLSDLRKWRKAKEESRCSHTVYGDALCITDSQGVNLDTGHAGATQNDGDCEV